MNTDEFYMARCLQLAELGMGTVAPNPMVGAVLVYDNNIIGEGYHESFGMPHAEVNCLKSVMESSRNLIERSTLYISLEPCVHFGKTPPCTDLIIKNRIPRVVIACKDGFEQVNGAGIRKLKDSGIEVTVTVLEQEAIQLNRRFFTLHSKHRPYILLKWAQCANGFIAGPKGEQISISNEIVNRLVHRWRSEEAAILVGAQTALNDNPNLSNRLWTGKQPIRIVIDKYLGLPETLNLFDGKQRTLIYNVKESRDKKNTEWIKLPDTDEFLPKLLNDLYKKGISSILIEGGRKTHLEFMDAGYWDEALVISSNTLFLSEGIPAPLMTSNPSNDIRVLSDTIRKYINTEPS